MEMLQSSTGARFTHIPYKATSAALVDLMAGNVDAMFDFVQTSSPHLRTGKLNALAITSAERAPVLPDVPTMAEAGFPAVDAIGWGGLFAPANTPADIVKRLSDETAWAMKSPEVKAALDSVSAFSLDMPHETFQPYVASQAKRWVEIIRKSGATPQ
ncbi:MAG TPA: tripartite tricarboxylate transporter substrate binding protein [Hydrogenophaga sp.]